MKIATRVSAEQLTTFRVGGVVETVVTIESSDEVREAIAFAQRTGAPVVPLGGGSNVLLPDGALATTVLRYAPDTIRVVGTIITAHAGAVWDEVVRTSVLHGLRGIENLSGIPGTIGGALVQNIGAYGAVLSDTVLTVTAFDLLKHEWREFSARECAFGYRSSIFGATRDRWLITCVTLSLSRDAPLTLNYADLRTQIQGDAPELSTVRDAIMRIRRGKFPLLSEYGTAGSYFLNPIVTPEVAQVMTQRFPQMPTFLLPEGGIKVPLAWILDHVLGLRGTVVNGVEVWRGQSLVLAAHRGATAAHVRQRAAQIASHVFTETRITITPEVREL